MGIHVAALGRPGARSFSPGSYNEPGLMGFHVASLGRLGARIFSPGSYNEPGLKVFSSVPWFPPFLFTDFVFFFIYLFIWAFFILCFALNSMVLHTAMREPLLHIIVTNILHTSHSWCLVEHITNGICTHEFHAYIHFFYTLTFAFQTFRWYSLFGSRTSASKNPAISS